LRAEARGEWYVYSKPPFGGPKAVLTPHCDARQIRQLASVTSRVEVADTVVRSAAILPPFQRWKLVAIPGPPGRAELAFATVPLGHIHAALEITESAVGSARVIVKAPVALNGRWRNLAGGSRRVVRVCGRANLDRAQEGGGRDHQETEWRAHKGLHFCRNDQSRIVPHTDRTLQNELIFDARS
jgi:hypothetical protein